MDTCILLGNTSIKVARGDTQPVCLPADVAVAELAALVKGAHTAAPIAASVNPAAEKRLNAACREAGISAPLYAGRDFPAGVRFAVGEPDRAGIDRVLNVKAAWHRCHAACAAVDLGTAISISVADDEGRFAGGAILPGLALSLRALHRETAFLPELLPAPVDDALGGDTASAMLSGVLYGARGAVAELVDRMGRSLGSPLEVFLTGGDRPLVAPLCPREWQVVDTLTLEGLRLAHAESRD